MKYKSKYKEFSVEETIKKYTTTLRFLTLVSLILIIIVGFFAIISNMEIFTECIFILLIWFVLYVLRTKNFNTLNDIIYVDCDPKKYIQIMKILEGRDKKKKAKSTLNLCKAYGYYYTNELDLMKECLCKVNFKSQSMGALLVTINLWLNYAIKTKNKEIYDEYYNKLYNIVTKNKKEEKMVDELKNIVRLNNYIEEKKEKEAREIIEKNEKEEKYFFKLVLNNFNKAQVNLMAGNKEEAKKNLEFVIENGNTMYKRIEAEELLKSIN